MANTNDIKLVKLSDEPEMECDMHGEESGCPGSSYPYGAIGYSGYVSSCHGHAKELLKTAIESGWMVKENE
jgi:hypothetical protein